MKKSYLVHIFAMCSLFFLALSCEKVEKVEPTTLSIHPDSDAIILAVEGQDYRVDVTSNALWTAQSNATDWCTVQDITEKSFIIRAAENKSLEARPEAEVTITAGDADNIKVMVIKVNQPGTEATSIQIEPAEEAVNFTCQAAEYKVSVTSNRPWTVKADGADWCEVKDVNEKSFTITVTENVSEDSRSGAQVVISAGEGELQAQKVIKVSQEAAVYADFKIEVTEIMATGANVKVTPSVDDALYYYDVISQALLDEHHESDVKVLIESTFKQAAEDYGGMDQAIKNFATKGVQSYNYTKLAPETDYIAFAAEINSEGKVRKDVTTYDFVTPELPVEELSFEIEFTNTDHTGTDFTITPSDDTVPYYYAIRPKSVYGDHTNLELMNIIVEEDGFMIDWFSSTGVQEYLNEGVLMTNTSQLVIVFGWVDGQPASTEATVFEFRTANSDLAPEECRFTAEITEISAISADVTITPNDLKAPYLWDIMSEADYEQNKADMKTFVENYAQTQIDMFGVAASRDVTSESFSKVLVPGTKYYIWASRIDEYGKLEANVEVQMVDSFTTLEDKVGDATVEVTIGKYFNGDDLYAKNPEKYADAQGKVYVQVTFAANEKASVWYGSLIKEDPNDHTDNISDKDIINSLVAGGSWCPTGKLYYCDWDAEYTALAVAMGTDEYYGPVVRIHKTFTKEGASPISEFVEPE